MKLPLDAGGGMWLGQESQNASQKSCHFSWTQRAGRIGLERVEGYWREDVRVKLRPENPVLTFF